MRKFPKKVFRKIQKLLNPLDWKFQNSKRKIKCRLDYQSLFGNRASAPRDCSLFRKFRRSSISQWKFPKVKIGTFGREDNFPCSKNHKLKDRKTKVKERFHLHGKSGEKFPPNGAELLNKQNETGWVSTIWQYSRTFKLKGLFHYIPHRYNHVFHQEAQE